MDISTKLLLNPDYITLRSFGFSGSAKLLFLCCLGSLRVPKIISKGISDLKASCMEYFHFIRIEKPVYLG